MAEGQARGEHRADRDVRTERLGPHHLELAADQAALAEEGREEDAHLVARADPDSIRFEAAAGRGDLRGLDVDDRVFEAERDAVLACQPGRQAGDDFPGVDADLLGTPEERAGGPLVRRERAVAPYAGRIEQLEVFVPGPGPGGGFAENPGFILVVGQVQRAGPPVPEAARAEHLQPGRQAPPGEVAQRAKRLADRPEHAEVADGGPHDRQVPSGPTARRPRRASW